MSRSPYEIHISMQLDPDEYPEEGRAWNLLGDRIHALLEEARNDEAFAAIADNLDPHFGLFSRRDQAYLYDEDGDG